MHLILPFHIGLRIRWLDIRPTNPKYPALQAVMENRAKTLAQNGCQAIEWDNVDCWSNKCVSDQAAGTLTMKNAQYVYNKWLADVTHKYSMAVGLKVRVTCSAYAAPGVLRV